MNDNTRIPVTVDMSVDPDLAAALVAHHIKTAARYWECVQDERVLAEVLAQEFSADMAEDAALAFIRQLKEDYERE